VRRHHLVLRYLTTLPSARHATHTHRHAHQQPPQASMLMPKTACPAGHIDTGRIGFSRAAHLVPHQCPEMHPRVSPCHATNSRGVQPRGPTLTRCPVDTYLSILAWVRVATCYVGTGTGGLACRRALHTSCSAEAPEGGGEQKCMFDWPGFTLENRCRTVAAWQKKS
jgi:hypothetical protein